MQHNVRSAPMPSARQGTHVVSRSKIVRLTIILLRMGAILLLIASTFGNYVQFAGGWEHVSWSWRSVSASLAAISWQAVFFAVVYQAIFSALQWGFKAQRQWLPYALALLASVIPSFLTYNTWLDPYLSAQIGLASPLVIFLAATFADAIPEWVLVE